MSPKKQTRRGGLRGRGRGMPKRRGPKPRQPSSPCVATADDTDAEGTSTDGNAFPKMIVSPTSSPPTKKRIEYNEERELSLPRLKPTVIPENSAILTLLNHEEDSEYIMTDDELDHIQWDLEAMLTSLIIRKNTIKDELATFASMQFTRSLNRTAKNPKLPTIRPRAAAEISPVNECRKIQVEFDATSKELPPNKTESANKFWSLVEPYLARVKKEDLNWLEDLVKSYSPNQKLYEVPPLGEHYAKNWAKEELEMQKSQSSCSPRPISKKLKLAERVSPEVVELVNRANAAAHDGSVFKPIYQRVVSALLEHSHMSIEDLEEHFPEYDDVEDKPQEMSNVCQEFYAEQNVKKQLYKLGLMGRHSKPVSQSVDPNLLTAKPDEDQDEILEEINKCDDALTQLREMNKNHLTILLHRCRKDYVQDIINTKLERINNEILNFKRQQNESWTKEKKIAQITEEDDELSYLLNQRSKYLLQLQTVNSAVTFDPDAFLSPSISDDSESSDEESTISRVKIKTEMPELDNDIKENIGSHDVCKNEKTDEYEMQVNIKEEIIEEMQSVELNDHELEYNDEQVAMVEVSANETEKTVDVKNETEEADKDKNEKDDQTELNIDIKINDKDKQQGKIIDEESSSAIKPNIRRRRGKSKNNITENEQMSKIECRKPIRIKQEPVEYEPDLDPSGDTIDGIKRELRPRNLNDPQVFFEPYDGTSEDSDYTDLSD
ncbi:transcriptional adapter 3-like isoform X2 [Sipha flava]|uniref:Transcriptional adapter 3-like isoform X2 n=1 Tax=Sipha flava TaxID=143950 RepID=A0A8B8FDB3_9HEMI|nr:transcriptional adapter 3-like isoform X2 [Sipha flava]